MSICTHTVRDKRLGLTWRHYSCGSRILLRPGDPFVALVPVDAAAHVVEGDDPAHALAMAERELA